MKQYKLSKKSQVRSRLMRNMLSSLILFEQIQTTQTKAKALKSRAEKFISRVKSMDDDINLKRYIASELYAGSQEKAYDLSKSIKHVETFRVNNRSGDNSQMMIIKLVIEEVKPKKSADPKAQKKE